MLTADLAAVVSTSLRDVDGGAAQVLKVWFSGDTDELDLDESPEERADFLAALKAWRDQEDQRSTPHQFEVGPDYIRKVGDSDAEELRDILVGMLAFDGSHGIHNYTRLGELRERAAKIIRHGEITAKQGEHYKPSQQPAVPAPSPSMVGGAGIELDGWRPMSEAPKGGWVDVLYRTTDNPDVAMVGADGEPFHSSSFAWRPVISGDYTVPPNWREIAEHFAAMEARGA